MATRSSSCARSRAWRFARASWQSACGSALALLLLVGVSAEAAPAAVVVVTPYPQRFQAAFSTFEQTFGRDLLTLRAVTTLRCADVSDAAVLYVHGAFWSREMDACAAEVQSRQRAGMLVGGTIPAVFQAGWRVTANTELGPAAPYLRFGGDDNLVGFLGAVYNAAGGTPRLRLKDAVPQADAGIYHPKAPNPFFSLNDYLAWYRAARLAPDDAPLVGLTFFQTNLFFGDLAHIDALIDALEARGIGVVPAYGWPLEASKPFLLKDQRPIVELLLCLNLLMPSPENGNFLAGYGIHAINLTTTTQTYEEWSSSRMGLPPGRVSLQLGTPERTGATEPILVATTRKLADGSSELVPVPERIDAAAARVERWLALRSTPNADKRLALIYFNNPPGKAMLGASYLDLFPSLANVLERLHEARYFVGQEPPSADALQTMLLRRGRNVGDYAPGELEAMVNGDAVSLLPLELYETWYRALPAAFRTATEATWGAPSSPQPMTVRRNGRTYFVIPGVQLGNVFVGPQPLRDTLETPEAAHHADRAAPHAYIAYYLWLRHRFGAHAIVHMGRHGTLEWLPGKDVAQSDADPGEVLIGPLPHLYYYVVDGGGEFLQAKRRSQAVVVSHLTPLLAAAGLGPDYTTIKAAIANRARLEHADDPLRQQYEQQILEEARRLGLFGTLSIDDVASATPDTVARIVRHVEEAEEETIPLGLHAIGSIPSDTMLRAALRQFLATSFTAEDVQPDASDLDTWTNALVDGTEIVTARALPAPIRAEADRWLRAIRTSGEQELDSLVRALDGLSLATGVSGDPLRSPDAVPTGRNMHDQDPRMFPTRAAWSVGQRMATELLERQQRRDGRYPDSISFVLWYGESNRTQGIAEAQALALLGVEPVWNGRGQVDGVKLIPAEQLGRPRVDVVLTMSGLYRDGLPEKLDLLDRAVTLAAEAPDDNVIRANARRVERQLQDAGVSADDAKRASLARLFGPAPQAFGPGLDAMMASSQDDNDQNRIASRYVESMNYAYGGGLNGVRITGNLAAQLSSVSAVVHARSTNLYGLLDNDETYQFAGGLSAAVTRAAGRAPDVVVSNLRRPGSERIESLREFLGRELDTRAWNPTWIAAMQASGYAGARTFAQQVENLYGLRATAPGEVDRRVWQQMLDVYVKDRFNLGLPAFFARENPWAQQMLAARLLEIDRQGVYRFDRDDREVLLRTYVRSVNQFGVSCYANACANPRLQGYILDALQSSPAASAAERMAFAQRMRLAQSAPTQPSPVVPAYPTAAAPTFFTLLTEQGPRAAMVSLPRLLPSVVDRSWLLLLVPALLSPFLAVRRARRGSWSAHHRPLHHGDAA